MEASVTLDPTIAIVLAALFAVTVVMLGGFAGAALAVIWWMRRNKRKKVAAEKSRSVPLPPTPKPPPKPVKPPKPPPVPPGMAAASPAPPSPPKPPPAPQDAPFSGVFGDTRRPPNESAATELFQRGAATFDWDEDDSEEEDGATEVFSAHHLEELGEFTMGEDD